MFRRPPRRPPPSDTTTGIDVVVGWPSGDVIAGNSLSSSSTSHAPTAGENDCIGGVDFKDKKKKKKKKTEGGDWASGILTASTDWIAIWCTRYMNRRLRRKNDRIRNINPTCEFSFDGFRDATMGKYRCVEATLKELTIWYYDMKLMGTGNKCKSWEIIIRISRVKIYCVNFSLIPGIPCTCCSHPVTGPVA